MLYVSCHHLPGDDRNDLYLTLRGGEFEKGRKTAQKNVEVRICIVDERGGVIPVSTSRHVLVKSGMRCF